MEQRPFEIEHIDPLGQGVSKKSKITFIEKTLPGEIGQATIYKEAKGVSFGFIKNADDIELESKDRVAPECPHYWECPGCQYLHTTYENEILFKKKKVFLLGFVGFEYLFECY